MLWVEKYRPKTFEDVVGNKQQKMEIQAWVEAWKAGNPQPALLLVGPAGTGKTTMAHIIANEFSEFIELNASDKRSKDVIMATVGESSSTMSLFGENKKLIIMDEVDGLQGNQDRGGASALNKIIKDSKQPIVMMANDFYSKQIATIKNNAKVIKMTKIRTPTINALLRKILREEGVEADQELLKKLAKRSNGDLRSALNTLQVIVEKGGELDEEALEVTSQKDNTATIFDGVTRVLKSKDAAKVKTSLFEMKEDPSLVMEYIAENIPREYEKKHEIKKAYEMISKADLFFGRTRQSREYAYWRYASDFMGPGVALSKDQTYKKFSKVQSPMAFSLMARSRGKRALRDRIAEKMELKMHISLEVAYTIFPYFEIMFQNNEVAWEIADFLELEDDEIKRFRKKKIPKKVITKMEAKKAEMREEEKELWRENIKKGIFEEFNSQNDDFKENNSIAKDTTTEKLTDNDNSTDIDELFKEISEEFDLNTSNRRIFNSNDDIELVNVEDSISKNKEEKKSKNKKENKKRVKKEKSAEEPREKGQTSLFNF
ncbi:MAG: replication factor C large subunit [archaeon]|nr:replication factor C large subunit [archaeon]